MDEYYEVTIKRVYTVPDVRREWVRVADSGNERNGGAVYGYAESPSTRQVEREVLRQQVYTLDVHAVIRAVNGL